MEHKRTIKEIYEKNTTIKKHITVFENYEAAVGIQNPFIKAQN